MVKYEIYSCKDELKNKDDIDSFMVWVRDYLNKAFDNNGADCVDIDISVCKEVEDD